SEQLERQRSRPNPRTSTRGLSHEAMWRLRAAWFAGLFFSAGTLLGTLGPSESFRSALHAFRLPPDPDYPGCFAERGGLWCYVADAMPPPWAWEAALVLGAMSLVLPRFLHRRSLRRALDNEPTTRVMDNEAPVAYRAPGRVEVVFSIPERAGRRA